MPRKIRYDVDKLDEDILQIISPPDLKMDLLPQFRATIGGMKQQNPKALIPLPTFPRMPKV